MFAMNPSLMIRHAFPDDVPAMLEIYRPFVEHTTITFEYEVPSVAEFRRRFDLTSTFFPWIVCVYDNVIVGYAYASKQHERAAYQWNAELSIYVHPDYQGKRVGAALYRCLLRLLRLQGFLYAHALVTLPNDKSLALHRRLGFQRVAVMEKTGYKHGQWLDVAELRLQLSTCPEEPTPPSPFRSFDPYEIVQVFREEAGQITYP